MASEDLNREQAADVEAFPNRLPVPVSRVEGPLRVVTADCQGGPLVRSALGRDEATAVAEEPAESPTAPDHRRGNGPKANKKRMAAVGAVYTIEPFVRTADEGLDEVVREKAARRRPRPAHKRVRAELLGGKVGLFRWLADAVRRRNPEGIKPLIFRSDGERALPARTGEYLPEDVICILDRFHVLEWLWKVAWCCFDEATQKPETQGWVAEHRRRLLEGKVGYVIGGLRQRMTKRGLKGRRRKTVSEAVGACERNRERMKYDEYLAAGYPIGSGVAEGACRHLVKDRLERAGMRWGPDGTQAMLELRATSLNGAWESFWAYHVEQQEERLYRMFRKTG